MKFRNPWIDPRICQLQPAQVQHYLLHNGWKLTGPAMDPDLIRYDAADGDERAPTLFLPVRVDSGSDLQCLIELVGELALWQDRFAGDVLTNLLDSPADTHWNGTSLGQSRGEELVTKLEERP